MLIKATMVDGKPEVGILPTGQVIGVIDELPAVADLLARIRAEAHATLKRLQTTGLSPRAPPCGAVRPQIW